MKNKRKKPLITFFKALFCTLIGLSFYIIGRKVIPFPEKWMQADKNHSLFFIGIFGHLSIGWIINYFFIFFINSEKLDPEKVKKWRNRISTVLISFYFILFSLISYWNFVKDNVGYIALLVLISLIIKCLIDVLIQWMNKYGICSGFSLLLFIEFLPTKWFTNTLFPNLRDNWQGKTSWTEGGLIQQPWFCLLLLLVISVFFIWIVNLKWEIPVESNVAYFKDNPLIKKHRFKLGFRINFPFMALYQLAQGLGLIFVGWKLLKGPLPNPNNNLLIRITEKYRIINSDLSRQAVVWQGGKEGIGESFFLLNNKKRLFGNFFQWIGEWKGIILLTLLLLILFRWLVMWVSIRKLNLKTKEISDKLKKRGIYTNRLYPGRQTRTLLKKIINYLIFFWFCIILLFNIVFDQIFTRLERTEVVKVALGLPEGPGQFFPRFLDWFGSIGIGTELYRQIKTKYNYIQRN